ncbi:hypothetical protein FALCPG4_012573 [Fusarium falciforme]
MATAIKYVAVLGASGTLGHVLVSALMKAGFVVTAVGRPNGKPTDYSHEIAVKAADYEDASSLAAALQGQHAVVEAFNPAAARSQRTIAEAAITAGVTHLITPDFSSDTFNPHVDDILIFEAKKYAQYELEDVVFKSGGALTWTAIIVGPWYDWGIETGNLWIDRENRVIRRFGSGDQKCSISRLALNGEAAVSVLRAPDKYRNRPAYFASHTVSTNDIIALLKELGGPGWKIVDIPLGECIEQGRALWEQDTASGVVDRLNTKAYPMLGTAALFDETNRYGANFGDKLELGWDEGLDTLATNLKKLVDQV